MTTSHSVAETIEIGRSLAQQFRGGEVIALHGDLGAGKTCLVKGIALGLGITQDITSPTFTLINEYPAGRLPLYHIDLYRLDAPQDAINIGIEDYINTTGVTVVEWAEKIQSLLPAATQHIRLTLIDETTRQIELPMITLALDTSTALGSVAVLQDDQLLAEETFTRDGLFAALTKLFGAVETPRPTNATGRAGCPSPPLSEISQIVVGVGPGSFTGTRAGIAAAKGLALPHNLPVIGVSSFDALALTAAPQMPPDCEMICVISDARRGEIYCAFYEPTGQRQGEIHISQMELLADSIHDPIWFVSSEMDRFRDALQETLGGFASPCAHLIHPRASILPRLAGAALPLEPLYLRPAEYKKTAGH